MSAQSACDDVCYGDVGEYAAMKMLIGLQLFAKDIEAIDNTTDMSMPSPKILCP